MTRIINSENKNEEDLYKINGFTFKTEKLFSNKYALDNQFEAFKKIAILVHSRPIFCDDEFQYIRLKGRVFLFLKISSIMIVIRYWFLQTHKLTIFHKFMIPFLEFVQNSHG